VNDRFWPVSEPSWKLLPICTSGSQVRRCKLKLGVSGVWLEYSDLVNLPVLEGMHNITFGVQATNRTDPIPNYVSVSCCRSVLLVTYAVISFLRSLASR